ncbi:MAG: hypothetical protein ACRELG_21025 [Gemmataceae bacterium]
MKANDLERLAGQVSPQNARQYALANGWQRIPGVNGEIALFNRTDSDLDQLIVPLQPTAPDYARRIVDVLANLADFERRPAEEILNDLLMLAADVIRYRVISPDTERGDLALEDGLRILEGAKRSLLAAACSVVSPVPYHPRMSRTEATQLLDSCRLLQTERGSFTIAIACPVRAVDVQKPLLDFDALFARQTTKLLMRSLSRLAQAIEADKVASVYETKPDAPIISANLCDAIFRMQPPDEKSQLSISVSWSGIHPPTSTDRVSQNVTFQHDYFPIIEDMYRKLRPSPAPAESLFVGFVDTLNGSPRPDGRIQGETRFALIHEEEEVIRAWADLGPDDYQTAVRAHSTVQIVKFKGILHMGQRTHRITNLAGFEIVQPTPSSSS